MCDYPLRVFFDCSTAHLRPATREHLENISYQGEAFIAATPYGWFVYADEGGNTDHPPDLARVLSYARRLGAEYVLFDADAPISDDLPAFEDHG